MTRMEVARCDRHVDILVKDHGDRVLVVAVRRDREVESVDEVEQRRVSETLGRVATCARQTDRPTGEPDRIRADPNDRQARDDPSPPARRKLRPDALEQPRADDDEQDEAMRRSGSRSAPDVRRAEKGRRPHQGYEVHNGQEGERDHRPPVGWHRCAPPPQPDDQRSEAHDGTRENDEAQRPRHGRVATRSSPSTRDPMKLGHQARRRLPKAGNSESAVESPFLIIHSTGTLIDAAPKAAATIPDRTRPLDQPPITMTSTPRIVRTTPTLARHTRPRPTRPWRRTSPGAGTTSRSSHTMTNTSTTGMNRCSLRSLEYTSRSMLRNRRATSPPLGLRPDRT